MIYYENRQIYIWLPASLKGFSPIFKQFKKQHTIRIIYDKLSQFGQTSKVKISNKRSVGQMGHG